MKYMVTFIILIFTIQCTFAQNYADIDSKVKNYPNTFNSIKHFANRIDKDFKTDLEKIRAVYYWISNTIEYDYKEASIFNNTYETISSSSEKEYQSKLLKLEYNYAEKVLKKKKGVCEGYSQLLRFTLLELQIESDVISGFTKTNPREIGKIANTSDHAWNAVKLDGEWKLIDATWSTGNEENKPGVFNFSDTYFLIVPEKMILTHYPKFPKWQLLKKKIKKSTFFYQPLFTSGYYTSGLKLDTKTKGLIKVKSNDNINLFFDEIDETKTYYYQFSEDTFSTLVEFSKVENQYKFTVQFKTKKRTYLTLFDEYRDLIDFKIIVAQ